MQEIAKNRTGSANRRVDRRFFLTSSGRAALCSLLWTEALQIDQNSGDQRPCGPGSAYKPSLSVAFVRRKEEYGMLWPGQIYDGQAALEMYSDKILTEGRKLGLSVQLSATPIYSLEEADARIDNAKMSKADGLLLVTLDRQQHVWPTVDKALESGIPTVVFSPIGTSFTTNTTIPSKKDGIYICSTDDFEQVAYGMKMIKAGAKMREMRFLVIKGDERRDARIAGFGTHLRFIPARDFIDEYNRIPVDQNVERLAKEYIVKARHVQGPSKSDVLNGIKSYVVARNLLRREECDGITMDCLGALGPTEISLPCIAWSKLNDQGVPAACEADLGACVTHALVQYLFDRPGFQQDPVAETAKECLIGAHCCCPTKLGGFSTDSVPFSIVHHHGNRDATVKPLWEIGHPVTVVDLVTSPTELYSTLQMEDDGGSEGNLKMLVDSGQVVDNISVPPAGGCVVSVMVRLDGVTDVLAYPGFHQLFFYGDFKKELKAYCQLFGIQVV